MAQNATQLKIIKTAEQLMWAEGYDGASLNDLVAKAGISKGGFFHYYPNKMAITLIVLEKYFNEQVLGPLESHLMKTNDGMPIKVAMMNWLEESFGAYAQKGFMGGCMVGNFALEVSDQDEELRGVVETMLRDWENMFVTYLRQPAQDGKLLMEPRQFARLLISMYQGIVMTCKVHKDDNRAARDFQALAEFIERMVRD